MEISAEALYAHYELLLGSLPPGYTPEALPPPEPNKERITAGECRNAVQKLRNNKSLAGYWLTAELLRGHEDNAFYKALAVVLDKAMQAGLPPSWNTLKMRSIHKKGNKLTASNYRGISLMGVLPKLLA